MTLNKPLISISGLTCAIAFLFALKGVFNSTQGNLPYAARQTIGIITFLGISAGILILFLEDSNALRYSIAGYYFIGALCQIGLLAGVKMVKHLYYIHDLVCGHVIFIPLFIMAGLQLPNHVQTWLLYHNALSADVVVGDILRYAQKAQKSGGKAEDNEELVEQIAELRKLIQVQEQMLMSKGLIDQNKIVKRNESTDAFPELFSPSADEEIPIHQPPQTQTGLMGRGRIKSMTGLDVWGPMTIGDGETSGEEMTMDVMSSYQNLEQSTPIKTSNKDEFSFSQPEKMPPR